MGVVFICVCLTLKLLENGGGNSLNSVSPIEANKEWPPEGLHNTSVVQQNLLLCCDGNALPYFSDYKICFFSPQFERNNGC